MESAKIALKALKRCKTPLKYPKINHFSRKIGKTGYPHTVPDPVENYVDNFLGYRIVLDILQIKKFHVKQNESANPHFYVSRETIIYITFSHKFFSFGINMVNSTNSSFSILLLFIFTPEFFTPSTALSMAE